MGVFELYQSNSFFDHAAQKADVLQGNAGLQYLPQLNLMLQPQPTQLSTRAALSNCLPAVRCFPLTTTYWQLPLLDRHSHKNNLLIVQTAWTHKCKPLQHKLLNSNTAAMQHHRELPSLWIPPASVRYWTKFSRWADRVKSTYNWFQRRHFFRCLCLSQIKSKKVGVEVFIWQ